MKSYLLPALGILCFWALAGRSTGAEPPQTAGAMPPRKSSPGAGYPSRSKTDRPPKEEIFRTPKELLLGINVWMRQFHLPELTRKELIVRLADQQFYSDAPPRAEYLLERIVENKEFELPVELFTEEHDDIALSEEYSFSKELRLPTHHILAIQVLNVPWNASLDQYGQQMKVVFTNIVIAHAYSK